MQIGEGTTLVADASVKGLPDIRQTRFDLSVPRLHSSAEAVDELALRHRAAASSRTSWSAYWATPGRSTSMPASRGLLSSFDMQLGAATERGRRVLQPADDAAQRRGCSSVRGDVETRNLRLGELLDRRDLLGNATLTAYVDGVIGKGYGRRQRRGQRHAAGLQRLCLRLAAARRPPAQPRVRRPHHGPRSQPRLRLLRDWWISTTRCRATTSRWTCGTPTWPGCTSTAATRCRSSRRIIAANAGGRSLDDLNGRIQVTDARIPLQRQARSRLDRP